MNGLGGQQKGASDSYENAHHPSSTIVFTFPKVARNYNFVINVLSRPSIVYYPDKDDESSFGAKMKVLLIEDDKKICDFVTAGLSQAGFQVESAGDGQSGLELAQNGSYDLLIADIMLPQKDGLQLVTELRAAGSNIPVLFLSAKRSIDERVRGFQIGGDDYLTKPFAFSELLARSQALIRRASRTPESSQLKFADLEMDLLSREVRRGKDRLDLQPKEFSLLEYFLRNPGRVLSKTQILEKVWQYDFDPQTNVVDVLVCRLRNRIEKGSAKYIKTIRGVGYVLRQN